ncbi:hypothetical protein BH24CHL4_BH24CHL4_27190 [soil metagenome]
MKQQRGSDLGPHGIPGLLLAALIAITSIAFQPQGVSAHATLATFDIDAEVSAQDAGFVIEGIRLAQDFFIEQVGAPIDQEVRVEVLDTSSAAAGSNIAVAQEDRITVYTGSIGWNQTSPAERYAVIVHEYTHFYQYLMLGDDSFASPAWFDEGIAEYLSVLALSDLGVIDRTDFETYWALLLERGPIDRSLEELESWLVFQATEGALYPLSYFSIAKLFADNDLNRVTDYYALMASGESFERAFLLTFGLTPNEHYAEFEVWRAGIIPGEIPPDIAVFNPVERKSDVRPVDVPRTLIADDQVVIHALTLPATSCSLTLIQPGSGGTLLERTTFADGTGDVYWFITIPDDWLGGLVTIDMDCGGAPVTRVVILEP